MGGEGALQPEHAVDRQVVGRLILCSYNHLQTHTFSHLQTHAMRVVRGLILHPYMHVQTHSKQYMVCVPKARHSRGVRIGRFASMHAMHSPLRIESMHAVQSTICIAHYWRA